MFSLTSSCDFDHGFNMVESRIVKFLPRVEKMSKCCLKREQCGVGEDQSVACGCLLAGMRGDESKQLGIHLSVAPAASHANTGAAIPSLIFCFHYRHQTNTARHKLGVKRLFFRTSKLGSALFPDSTHGFWLRSTKASSENVGAGTVS